VYELREELDDDASLHIKANLVPALSPSLDSIIYSKKDSIIAQLSKVAFG
jgi:hypothetical protein